MLDTKDFVMRTGVRTFEAAAFLRKLGADMVAVKGLFANDFECIKHRSRLVSGVPQTDMKSALTVIFYYEIFAICSSIALISLAFAS